jgi:hypothetical protein
MALVEVRLHSFLYRFRRLSWRQEASVRPADGEDYRDAVLAHALTDVSGPKSRPWTTPGHREIPKTVRRRSTETSPSKKNCGEKWGNSKTHGY